VRGEYSSPRWSDERAKGKIDKKPNKKLDKNG
jgi:hypothetical protein